MNKKREKSTVYMKMQKKSSNGITLVPLESCLLSDRTVFITGKIEETRAIEFVKELIERKSTRLNSSHDQITSAVVFLKKKNARTAAVGAV